MGASAFEFEVLAEISERDEETINYSREVKELERMYIDELQPMGDKGYNS